jgi:hypothetical protein
VLHLRGIVEEWKFDFQGVHSKPPLDPLLTKEGTKGEVKFVSVKT